MSGSKLQNLSAGEKSSNTSNYTLASIYRTSLQNNCASVALKNVQLQTISHEQCCTVVNMC